MNSREEIVTQLTTFKSAREAMVHANEDEFLHCLREFLKEIDRNPLCLSFSSALPPFDVQNWWQKQIGASGSNRFGGYLESLDLPGDKDEKLCILLDFARSFAAPQGSGQLDVVQFGFHFSQTKFADACRLAQSFILRPLAEDLTQRIRTQASLANPDVRELAGVPLDRIPSERELGIFLSHKSADKALVRKYHAVLRLLGFSPWLDEEEVVAGHVVPRRLVSGMDESCAAVFFITPNFKDERWLEQELNLAVNRKIDRGDRFSIIALAFGGAAVPRLLQTYAYKHIDNDIDGLYEIVRALPIELGPPRWKSAADANAR